MLSMKYYNKKQIHRYREQTRGYQRPYRRWESGRWGGHYKTGEVGGTNYWVLHKLQGCVVQQGKYGQYFVITVNETFKNHIKFLKTK